VICSRRGIPPLASRTDRRRDARSRDGGEPTARLDRGVPVGRVDRDISLIRALIVNFDVDGNRATGCNGADFRMFFRSSFGGALATILTTPTCAGASWHNNGMTGEQPDPDAEHMMFTFFGTDPSADELVDPGSFRWWGSISQWTDPTQVDKFPDAGSEFASCYLTPARASVRGYSLARADGIVNGFGDVGTCGSVPAPLAARAVGLAATSDHGGTWVVASDGGIVTSGDAPFFGSTGAIRLNRPIVGMASTPSGRGYWLVASDGGIFSYGDAAFHGSTGALRLVSPIVGMASSASGGGYNLVAADGGVFAFGDAAFAGSLAGVALPAGGVVGIAR
jgi:hypothetical protein